MELDPKYLIEDMGFSLLPGKCVRCGSPLFEKGSWMGCWQCVVNKESARRGRSLLEKLRGLK